MALDKIDEEMDKVTDHGVGLVAVAQAVKSLNLTLAHHTAWTEERFEAVDRRFDAIDKKFDAIDVRFDIMDRKIDTGHSLILDELNKLSARVERVVAWAIRDELKVREIDE